MGFNDEAYDSAHQLDPTKVDDDVDAGDDEVSVLSEGSRWEHFQQTGKLKFSLRKLWVFTGPGFLMSIAYLDPGNLEADLQLGASGKYQLLWVLLIATLMGLVLQNIASKLGVVTGRHLAQHCCYFPKHTRYALWIMTEIALICADCQEVVGSAIAIKILSNGTVPLWAGCIITAADCFVFMLLDRNGVRKLEALFGVFITTMVCTFGFQYFSKLPPQGDVLEGTFVPRMTSNTNFQSSVGLVGAVIMPHNLFLHSALVLSRKVERDFEKEGGQARYRVKEALFYNRVESTAALMLSFVINLFVVCVFAHLSYVTPEGRPVCSYDGHIVMATDDDCDTIKDTFSDLANSSCTGIGLLTAGDCLKQSYGENWWLYIWALGVLAAGQASTITGTYAGQFIMEGFLDLRVKPAMRTFISRTFSLIPALIVAINTPGNPGGMDTLNEWLNVAQAIQLPFAMLPVLYFGSNTSLGEFATKGWTAVLVWSVAILVMLTNVYSIYLTAGDLPNHWYVWVMFTIIVTAYAGFVGYLIAVTARFIKVDGDESNFVPIKEHGEYSAIVGDDTNLQYNTGAAE